MRIGREPSDDGRRAKRLAIIVWRGVPRLRRRDPQPWAACYAATIGIGAHRGGPGVHRAFVHVVDLTAGVAKVHLDDGSTHKCQWPP